MPLCEQPGCGRELVSHPCHLAPYACIDPHLWCDRSEEEHRLCAKVAELREKLAEAEQRVIIAEQAQQDDLNMRLDARGFISDLYAERGQDPRVAYLCNQALGVLRA